MGLIDVLNGMQHGPRGAPQPAEPGRGGMSKTTMALLAFLAYKAYKSMTGAQAAPADTATRYPSPQRDERDSQGPGGLAGVLRTIFGGGSVPAPVLRRGVDNTVRDLETGGQGEIARSWVGRGANRAISPSQLGAALGDDAVRDLMDQTGMERDELLDALSQHLPRVIDHLTPDGRLPSEQEIARLMQNP
jgi:uncharacterized protein YidB (DUF937 family)